MTSRDWVIAGFMFTFLFTSCGLLGWLGANDLCTGTESVGYNFSILCHSGLQASLFCAANFLLLYVLYTLFTQRLASRFIRYTVVIVFILYGIWIIFFPYGIWTSPYFMARHYPPNVNPNCLECPLMTPTSLP